MKKPKLSADQLVEHMEKKGITFNYISKGETKQYLQQNNNYFKVSSYRKNFEKHPDGINKGKYINLDFAFLKDLAIIDMRLRYALLHMCLNLEHFSKVRLMTELDISNNDGYDIVESFFSEAEIKGNRTLIDKEIDNNLNNSYCGDLCNKYKDNFPVWPFIEVITFGRYIYFYKHCADLWENKNMQKEFYLLLAVKELRNAAAHNNCILNDLRSDTSRYQTSHLVTKALDKIEKTKHVRRKKMSNSRIQQIVTLLFAHKLFVTSRGVDEHQSDVLNDLIERMCKNKDFYANTELITTTFDFLKDVVDTWFPKAYTDIS